MRLRPHGLLTARVIDIHAHAVLEETFGTAGRYGPELLDDAGIPVFRVGDYRLRGVRYRGSAFMDVGVRLAAMDRAGIDFAVLSPNPLTYFHFIEPATAIAFCRAANDAMAALVAPHPGRLAGFCALPMQDVAAAVDELHRAVGELGLLAPYVGTDCPLPLDDPAFDPLYQALVDLNEPLFIHPGPAGIDGPPGDARLKGYELDILAGFAGQETLAVARLIFGGVLDRFPELDVCVSHGGGAIAFMAGRMAKAARKRPWVPDHLRPDGAFEARLRRIWYDVHVHDDRSLALLEQVMGPDRLVYGTNFAGWDQPESAQALPTSAPLAANARRLLRVA
jgi:aminocarboxymuconate-semialdehyde decarboxylase